MRLSTFPNFEGEECDQLDSYDRPPAPHSWFYVRLLTASSALRVLLEDFLGGYGINRSYHILLVFSALSARILFKRRLDSPVTYSDDTRLVATEQAGHSGMDK